MKNPFAGQGIENLESIVSRIRSSHARMRGLFGAYRLDAGNDGGREAIVEDVCREIHAGSRLEREQFYPALRGAAVGDSREIIDLGIQEHQAMEGLVDVIREMDPRDPECDEAFRMLVQSMEIHMEDEERVLFPLAEKRLASVSRRLRRVKNPRVHSRVRAQRPHSPDRSTGRDGAKGPHGPSPEDR